MKNLMERVYEISFVFWFFLVMGIQYLWIGNEQLGWTMLILAGIAQIEADVLDIKRKINK